MLLSLSSPSSAGGASDYYVKGSAKNPVIGQYYLSQEGPSFWGGGAKATLSLPDGPVQSEDFINMLNGHLPNGQKLGRMFKGEFKRDLARDLTMSASKTASILAASEHGQPIIEAFIRSQKKTMSFVENDLAKTRIYDRATKTQVVTGNQKIVYASFIEMLNRENEPHLHGHNVIINLTLGEDKKFRSMMMGPFYSNKLFIGAVARGYFGAELKKLGFSLEPAGRHGLFEIKGISQEVIDAFSTRRAEIIKAAGSGPKDAQTLAKLVLTTRPPKTKVIASELVQNHKQILSSLGHSIKSIWSQAQHSQTEEHLTPSDALNNAITNLSETQRDYSYFDLLQAGLTSVYGNVTVDELQTEIAKQVEAGKLLQSKDGEHFTTPKTLDLERLVIEEANLGQLKGGIMSLGEFEKHEPNLSHLTLGQFDAVKLVLTDREDKVGAQGFAGTGKTTLLKAALPLAREKGLRIIGIAPSQTAANALEDSGVFDQVMTSQKFVMSPTGNSSTLLIVDESSMLGTKDMLSILRFANSKNMPKVVLMGDTEQLKAIQAGEPFKDLQKAGMRTAHVNEIVRQKDPRHRAGIKALAEGNIPLAFKTLDKEIHEVTRQDMTQYAVKTWEKLNDPRAPIAVQTHKQKKVINAAIKASLLEQLQTPPDSLAHKVWRPVKLQVTERTQFRAYGEVTHIRFNRAQKRLGVRGGEVFKIVGRDEERSSLTLSNGKSRITFIPANHARGETMIETYKTEDITLHSGDRVRFTRGQRGHINNNDLATLKEITDTHAVFELDKGKTVTLTLQGKSIRHLDHGWASTAHALQGLTVPNAMAIMPSHQSPLTTLSNLYVGASRHVGRLAIITDNTNRLMKTLEEDTASKLEKITYITDKPKPEPEPELKPELTPQGQPERNTKPPDRPEFRTMYTVDPRFIADPDKQTPKPQNSPAPEKEGQRDAERQPEPQEDRQRELEAVRQRQRNVQRSRGRGGR